MTKKLSAYILFALMACVGLFNVSCNYKLANTPVNLPFKSVYVKPVRNDSMAPQVDASLSTQVRNQLARVAQLKLEKLADADAILEITVTNYDNHEIASDSDDTGIGQAFRFTMTASCRLYDRVSGKVYLANKIVRANMDVYNTSASGVLEQEYQNMPQLCRRLATEIANEITAIW